jgi:hypothetical protein
MLDGTQAIEHHRKCLRFFSTAERTFDPGPVRSAN